MSKKHRRRWGRKPPLKVIWDYEPVPDAEERINRAYRLLFDDLFKDEFGDRPIDDPKDPDHHRYFPSQLPSGG